MVIESGTIDVWTIDLDAERDRVSAMLELLSGAERVRAARFHTSKERLRFVIAHGALRDILARYTGIPSAALRFETTRAGKPFVPGAPVSFNMAHTEGLSVCAAASSGEVGVDVERVRRVADSDAIARRYFGPAEIREHGAAAHAARALSFFSTWTRKEAIVKGTGDRLVQPLDALDIGTRPLPAVVRVASAAGDRDWHLHAFHPAAGYIGAVACDHPIERVVHFDFADRRDA